MRYMLGVTMLLLVLPLAARGLAQEPSLQSAPPPPATPRYPYYPEGYPPSYGYHSSTAGEGYARGIAAIMRAAGDSNLRHSLAARNYTEAQEKLLENRLQATETYFQMKAINDKYREMKRGPRPTREQLVRIAAEAAPDRLAPSQLDPVSGEISWPVILRDDQFANELSQLEQLFRQRAQREHLTSEQYMQIQQVSELLLAELRSNLQSYPPMDYVEAKSFLESLKYEARFAAG